MKWSELRGELWARAVLTGVTPHAYRMRIRHGMSPDEAVDKPIDGSTAERLKPIEGLSVPRHVYRARVVSGWSHERAATEPVAPRQPRSAPIPGLIVSRRLYRSRIERGWTPERAATTPRCVPTAKPRAVSYDCVRNRIAAGIDPELARTAPPYSLRERPSRWSALRQEQRDAALALGISKALFLFRAANKWTTEEAISVPPGRWRSAVGKPRRLRETIARARACANKARRHERMCASVANRHSDADYHVARARLNEAGALWMEAVISTLAWALKETR